MCESLAFTRSSHASTACSLHTLSGGGGSLAHVLKWLLPLQECLQQASNPSKFDGPLNLPRAENNRRGTSDPLRTKAITDAILDSVTWAYGRALEHLQKALARFLGWCEGCPCHCQCTWGRADEMPRQSMQRRRGAFLRFLGQDRDHVLWDTCPVMGKRAPELACGVAEEALGHLCLQGEAYVIVSSSPASSEDRAAILRYWHAGAAHVMAGLALKLACWSTFAMEVGRSCAPRPCECPGGSKDMLGPLQSGATCSHAPPYVRRVPRCRLTFQTFCREHGCWSPRAETPLDFHLRLLNLKFIPTVDRVMESLPL